MCILVVDIGDEAMLQLEELVKSGRYENRSEAVREAIKLLVEYEDSKNS